MEYQERLAQARAYYNAGLTKVSSTPEPFGQVFKNGSRVKIDSDLGIAMSHFPSGIMATVLYTHAHAYGGDNVKSYCLGVDGYGQVSWYHEHQLTAV